MPDYTLSSRTLPLDDSWDVIVAGGGPAGVTAATSAAREGAKTLVIETAGALGGMGTLGLVPWFCGYHDGRQIIARGLAERVRLTLRDNMPHYAEKEKENPITDPPIDPELLKATYDSMVTGAGARVLFHGRLCAVEKSAEREVETLIVATKDGLRAYRAKVYVDCTGDGDLATWAGAEVEKGDENGGLQPATHCFVITNVDEERYAQGPKIHFYDPDSPIHKAVRSEKYPDIVELHTCNRKLGPGTFGFNTGHVFDIDNTNPESVTAGLLHGRKMARQYRDAFAEYHPAFKDSFLVSTGALLGVRETRRIMGDYYLTTDDYMARRSFPDEICRNAYNLDIHGSKERTLEMATKSIEELKEINRKYIRSYNPGESFGVPYRCLTPKALDNVLVAGRCISSDRRVNGSVRIMACALNTGEAAGAAAAMAVKGGIDVHSVDTDALRARLKELGAYLPDAE